MTEPSWITVDDCIAFHGQLLARFGGLDGIRDMHALEAALARPKNLFAYEEPTCFELASCYAFGIVINHPFVDGNKRSGFMAAALFLEVNGYELTATEEDAAIMTLGLAAREIEEPAYAVWLSENTRPRNTPDKPSKFQ